MMKMEDRDFRGREKSELKRSSRSDKKEENEKKKKIETLLSDTLHDFIWNICDESTLF